MTMISMTANGRCEALVDALRAEFGSVLAERIFEAEAADLLWEARVQERYLGQQIGCGLDDEEPSIELSRVAFLSDLRGRWWAGVCLINGDAMAVDLLWKRTFGSRVEAEFAFLAAH